MLLLLGLQRLEGQHDHISSARCLRRADGFDAAVSDVLQRYGDVLPQPRLISVLLLLLGLQMDEQQPDNIYSARCLRRTDGFDSRDSD